MKAPMRLVGNIIWMLFGGIFTALYWFGVGCLFCITIVGIPLWPAVVQDGEALAAAVWRNSSIALSFFHLCNRTSHYQCHLMDECRFI